MSEKEPQPPVGSEEPMKPTHSLPRYSEPTPETHRKVSRETEAELALKRTEFASGARTLLIVLFLITIVSVPAIQLAVEMRAPRAAGGLPSFGVYRVYPAWSKIRAVRRPIDLWHLLPRAADLKAAEKALESDSVVSEWLLPRVQSVLSGGLGAGNEQVYLGRDAWLFYRPDVDYITGPPFLDAAQMRHRAHSTGAQADPVKAIVEFRNQLTARGVELIAVPVPMKPGIDADKLSARSEPRALLQNPSFSEFKARLQKEGVRVFDPGDAFVQQKSGTTSASLYLETDTHWRPETMEGVAENLAAFIQIPAVAGEAALQIEPKEISGLGDIVRMLKLPASQNLYRPEKVTIHEVSSRSGSWRSSKDADILLLGDSFSNIFSLSALGWGESAGFAEQLSRALGGRALDCILRNSDGAFATREILSRDLARGRDRLAGKKLVVWEFACRELAFGDWKLLEMKLGQPATAHFFVPRAGDEVVVSGTVDSISAVPRPGSVPYKDHILALHLTEVTPTGRNQDEALESLVYLWSMRDNAPTAAARLRPGDRITLRMRAWTDVSDQYEKINRSEIDDPAVQLEEPCWGEIVK